MKNKFQAIWASVSCCLFLSACGHQVTAVNSAPVVAPVDVVVNKPAMKQPIQQALPLQQQSATSPKPYRDIVIKPAPLPTVVVSKTVVRPTPAVSPVPIPVVVVPTARVVSAPKVRAKGDYRGAVSVADSLRQQYQQ